MSDKEDKKSKKAAEKAAKDKKASIKQAFDPDSASGAKGGLFGPDDLDIYVNKITLEAFIFHGKDVNYPNIDHLEYDPLNFTVDIVKKDATRQDLGVKIQWLVRPYFSKAEEIQIVQTKDGDAIDGITVPIKHKEKEKA